MKIQGNWGGNSKDNNLNNKVTYALFAIYLAALFWILLFKLGVQFSYMGNGNVNLIPFYELFTSDDKIDAGELIMNVVIFVPLGIYSGVSFKRWTFVKNLVFILSISLMLEVLQFILRIGALDITDIINNTIGGIVGLMILLAIEKLFNDSAKSQKFINIIAAIGTALMISLLFLLKLNLLPVRYQ